MDQGAQLLALVAAFGGALIYGFRMMVGKMCDITKIMADMQCLGERIARLEANYEQIKSMLTTILEKLDGGEK